MTTHPDQHTPGAIGPAAIVRCGIGGVFMGLANLVPGISGGTMLVAVGIYEQFINAISDLTRLRVRMSSLMVVAAVVVAAGLAIALLAGTISSLLTTHRWVMYALFIGLTLGGVPILLAMVRPLSRAVWIGAAAGAAGMIALALLQAREASPVGSESNAVMLFLAGVAGASAMILPGVSGAYLLLLMGQYRPILDAIHRAKEAAQSSDMGGVMGEAATIIPVGIGVVVGIAAVANLLRWLLHRYEKATLGVLIGLLLGAPAGLYPFKRGVAPQAGEIHAGEVVTEARAAELADKPKDWPEQIFTPGAGHIAGTLGMIVLGVGITLGVAHIGGRSEDD